MDAVTVRGTAIMGACGEVGLAVSRAYVPLSQGHVDALGWKMDPVNLARRLCGQRRSSAAQEELGMELNSTPRVE